MAGYDDVTCGGRTNTPITHLYRRDVPVGVPLDLSTPCNGVARNTVVKRNTG